MSTFRDWEAYKRLKNRADTNSVVDVLKNKSTGDLIVRKIIYGIEQPLYQAVFTREMRALYKLNKCSNIVNILGDDYLVISTTKEKVGVIYLEYINGIELGKSSIENFSAKERFSIIKQLLDAIEISHSNGIIHRDINPNNIMLTDDKQVKLIDFGICKINDMINSATVYKPKKITASPENHETDKSQKPQESAAQNDQNIQNSTETIAAAVPHPIIDLSPEKLADYNYLLGQFYIVDSNTEADAVQINAGDFLKQDLKITKETDTPQILIYHSHSQETFADSREGEESDTIVGVGDYLTQLLTENYGYQVVHLKEQFDMAGGELDRSAAYDYARDYLEPYLQENPDIQVIIDLHRDGIPEDRHLVTEINGKPTAQILFYNGLSYTTSKGSLDYLPNPYIQQNLAFSFQLEYQAAQYYPQFYRGIYLAGYRYNLHLRPRSLLLEAGAQTNTVQEVKNAMEPFADILDKVLQG